MAIIVVLSSVEEYEFETEVCFYVVWKTMSILLFRRALFL